MSTWPKDWLARAPGTKCPACGKAAGRPILRGLPSPDVFEAMDRGEIDVILGGCILSDDDPTHRCRACGAGFKRTRRERKTGDDKRG